MRDRTGLGRELTVGRAALPLMVITLALAPETASACTACTLEMFTEIFPFLMPWTAVFLAWSVIFILWYLVSPKGKGLSPKAGRICFELVGIVLIVLFTGILPLLFYWAYVVGRLWWRSWKNSDSALYPGVRIFSLIFNGVTSVLLVASVGLAYVGPQISWMQPTPSSHRLRGYDASAQADLRNCRIKVEAYFADHQRYPATLNEAEFIPSKDVEIAWSLTKKDEYTVMAHHVKGSSEYMTRSNSTAFFYRRLGAGGEWVAM